MCILHKHPFPKPAELDVFSNCLDSTETESEQRKWKVLCWEVNHGALVLIRSDVNLAWVWSLACLHRSCSASPSLIQPHRSPLGAVPLSLTLFLSLSPSGSSVLTTMSLALWVVHRPTLSPRQIRVLKAQTQGSPWGASDAKVRRGLQEHWIAGYNRLALLAGRDEPMLCNAPGAKLCLGQWETLVWFVRDCGLMRSGWGSVCSVKC